MLVVDADKELRAVAQESPLLALREVCLDDISGYEIESRTARDSG